MPVEIEIASDASTGSIDDLLDKTRKAAEEEKNKEKPAPTRRTPKPRGPKSLKEPLMAMYGSIGATVFAISPQDGILILENAEKMAESLDELGRNNPQVRKVLERMVTTSAVGAVVTAHAPVILGILANHDMLPKFPSLGKKADNGGTPESSENSPVPPADSENYVAPVGTLTPIIVEAG